jgi:hypothetical protein
LVPVEAQFHISTSRVRRTGARRSLSSWPGSIEQQPKPPPASRALRKIDKIPSWFDFPLFRPLGNAGKFKNVRGEFVDQKDFNGRPILMRSIISEINSGSCKFEQSFSADGGKTWEVN